MWLQILAQAEIREILRRGVPRGPSRRRNTRTPYRLRGPTTHPIGSLTPSVGRPVKRLAREVSHGPARGLTCRQCESHCKWPEGSVLMDTTGSCR